MMAITIKGRTTLAGATTVGWSPAALFAAGEQGAWFDPSDFERYMAPSATELVTNGNFSNGTTDWSATAATLSATNNVLTVTSISNFGIGASAGFPTVVGRTYKATAQLVSCSSSTARIRKTDSAINFNSSIEHLVNSPGWTAGQTFTTYFQATATTSYIMAVTDLHPSSISIANVSVREIPAISTATMFTDTAGTTPVTAAGQSVALMLDKSKGLTLGANIVLNGDFLDGTTYWTAGTGTTQSVVDGYLRVVAGSVFGSYQVVTTTAGKWYEVRGQIAMISGGTNVRIRAESGTTPGSTPIASSVAVTSTTPTDVVFVFLATASSHAIYLRAETAGSIGRFDNISVKEIPGNHATQATAGNRPVLQVENGKYYLEFNGATSNRWLQTGNIDFTATDKMSVFAGVRKNTSTAGMVAETSADAGTVGNPGAFFLVAGTDTGVLGSGDGYTSLAKGNAGFSTALSAQIHIVAPDTAVISSVHDIPAPLSTIRRNGVAGTSATGNKGTGNFGTYPLYVGRRAGTSLPFDGRLFSLVIRGATTSATDIARTERYVANRTGVVL